jgi:oligopeptide transport system ATP-binding protein
VCFPILDVTIQAQILDLMKDLQNRLNTSIVLITHNMGVVANIAQKVAVMYGGRLVETGLVDEIFYESANPYTQGLLDSIPNVSRDEEKLKTIPGTPPDLTEPPKGCPFAPRCPKAMKVCLEYEPPRVDLSETHWSRCWLLDHRADKFRNQAEEAERQ